jgi:plasmid stabilization system protein ParE
MGPLERRRIWDDPAIRDALAWYIARDSVAAADRWTARLFEAFETLAQSPGMGHARADLPVGAVSGHLSRGALAG